MSAIAHLDQFWPVLFWGVIATAVMSTLMEGAQLLGLSRMSLPFLFGTFVTERRDRAMIYGFVLYSAGGLVFAFFYAACFDTIGMAGWWLGTIIGIAHGLFLITVFLPLLPHIHPRMASEYDGPTAHRRLEPPGPFGVHYGRRTPFVTVFAQAVFGFILGAALSVH
jgi:hypothetical protein